MNRRDVLCALMVLAGAPAAWAHTPYGQWVVYRKKHLLIGAHRADPVTYALAKQLTGVLAEHLPGAKSRVARAPTAQRLASLIGTGQLDVAVLSPEDAAGMLKGSGRFEPYGPIALGQLAQLGSHMLVAHSRLPDRHAWLVAAALHAGAAVGEKQQPGAGEIPWHPGGLAYLSGKPEPSLQ
ncbi:MAG: hypothetical protein ACR2OM_14430 [Aestuariivirgaceae bacterium]